MTINSKKKNWKRWENCRRFALQSSRNVCIWHVDQTVFDPLTTWHEQSRFLLDNILCQLMTVNWQDLDMLVDVENRRLLETVKDPNQKDGFEGIQKLVSI